MVILMPRKIPSSILAFLYAVDNLISAKDRGKDIDFNRKDFNTITYAARSAARQCGLAFRSTGLISRNNRNKCPIFFLPGKGSYYNDNGTEYPDVYIKKPFFFALPEQSHIYFKENDSAKSQKSDYIHLERLTFDSTIVSFDELIKVYCALAKAVVARREMKSASDSEVGGLAKNSMARLLDDDIIADFLGKYVKELCRLAIIPQDDKSIFCGWKKIDNTIYYQAYTDIARAETSDSRRIQLGYPGESLLFAATLFSLTKPLYRVCKVTDHLNFVAQIVPRHESDVTSGIVEELIYMERAAYIWCNYRKLYDEESDDRDDYHNKWRNENSSLMYGGALSHRGFPLSTFNYEEPDQLDDNIKYFSFQDGSPAVRIRSDILKRYAEYPCLCLLFMPAELYRAYPKNLCLPLSFPLPKDAKNLSESIDRQLASAERHLTINARYMDYLNRINNAPYEEVRKLLKINYQKALYRLAPNKKRRLDHEFQLAYLLGTMYFYDDYLKARNEDTSDIERHIGSFEQDIGIVTFEDFRSYINEVLKGKRKIVHIDKANYLYIPSGNAYWCDFSKYCKDMGVKIGTTRLHFEKDCLIPKNAVLPQHEGAARYDHWLKLDEKRMSFLKISKKALGIKD